MSPVMSRQRVAHRTRIGATIALACLLAAAAPPAPAQDKPIATAEIANRKIRVEVLSLKRIEGNLVTLRWQLVNDDTASFLMTVGNMTLVDLAGRRSYSPGLSSSSCAARAGERTVCWATFAAPPAGTRTLAAKFYEQFELVTGIPVSD